MELNVSLEAVCRLIIRARALEAQDTVVEKDDEDESDTEELEVELEESGDEAIEDELRTMLEDLGEEEVAEVLALAWVGRGTYDASEWDEALEEANEPGEDPIDQLMDMPMLGGYLEAGLTAFDLDCEGLQAD